MLLPLGDDGLDREIGSMERFLKKRRKIFEKNLEI